MTRQEIEDYLKIRTTPIDNTQVQAGDIAVFTRNHFLTHTAIMLPDKKVVCHKPGGYPLCVDTLERARNMYGNVHFVRIKEKKDKKEKVSC